MKEIRFLHITNKGMAFDPQTGDSFQLNSTAEKILSLLQDKHGQEDIIQKIIDEFHIPYEKALTDYLEFTVQLQVLGLIK